QGGGNSVPAASITGLQRRSRRSPCAWTSGMLLLLSAGISIPDCVNQRAVAGDRQAAVREAEPADDELPPVDEVQLPGDDDDFVLRSDNYLSDEIETRGRLAPILEHKIAAIDRFCGLSGIQRRKLELSGRGDIKRRLDAIDRARSRLRR